MEYGRRWLAPHSAPLAAAAHRLHDGGVSPSTWMRQLDSSVVGNGNLYKVPLAGESLAWHTYVMPFAGRFLAGWGHSHATEKGTEMWIINGDASQLLAITLTAGNFQSDPNWDTADLVGSFGVRQHALPLSKHGLNADGVQLALRNHVLCVYRFSAEFIGGRPYGRAPQVKQSPSRPCSGWRFQAGQRVSLVAFNDMGADRSESERKMLPLHQRDSFPQHHRWYVIAELELEPDMTLSKLASVNLSLPVRQPSDEQRKRDTRVVGGSNGWMIG